MTHEPSRPGGAPRPAGPVITSVEPKRRNVRWMPIALVSLFVVQQVRTGDIWGATFGATALAYAIVAPHETVGAPRWRVHGVRLIGLVFTVVAALAIWKTLSASP
jgi:hypothetical protein